LKDLLEKMQNGDIKSLAKLITYLENHPEDRFVEDLPSKGAKVIGFTGSPGAGKSTLVNAVISQLRRENHTVGVIAIDPTSPFTGGSFLGDRIRMKTHFLDDGVFIRSMGSGTSLGGLNESVFDVIKLMDAFGFDYILIETVGTGQSEVDIVYVSDIVVLILSPGMGDDIQFLKSGIMEIGDIYVINKSDLDGADFYKMRLESMLSLSNVKKPIVKTIATSGVGVEELIFNIKKLLSKFHNNGEIRKRKERRLKKHAESILIKRIQKSLEKISEFDKLSNVISKVINDICKNN